MIRLVAGGFAALFLFAAALQYNDPDPLGWMAIYLAACGSCLATVLRRPYWWGSAAAAAVALAWAVTLMPEGWRVAPGELFAQWEMQDQSVEVAREMYGLVIVSAVCAAQAFLQGRRSPASG